MLDRDDHTIGLLGDPGGEGLVAYSPALGLPTNIQDYRPIGGVKVVIVHKITLFPSDGLLVVVMVDDLIELELGLLESEGLGVGEHLATMELPPVGDSGKQEDEQTAVHC